MKRQKLSMVRKNKGWSQGNVATFLGVAEITIRSIENGSRNPSSKLIAKFSYLFDEKPETLFPDIFLPSDDTKRIITMKTNSLSPKEAAK